MHSHVIVPVNMFQPKKPLVTLAAISILASYAANLWIQFQQTEGNYLHIPHPLTFPWRIRMQLSLITFWCSLHFQVGTEALMKEFDRLIEKSKANKDTDILYDKIKSAVKAKGLERHKWQRNAVDSIVSWWKSECNAFFPLYRLFTFNNLFQEGYMSLS